MQVRDSNVAILEHVANLLNTKVCVVWSYLFGVL